MMWFGYRRRRKSIWLSSQILVLGRVERDAVVDGQRDVAVLEERDEVVEVLQRAARRWRR